MFVDLFPQGTSQIRNSEILCLLLHPVCYKILCALKCRTLFQNNIHNNFRCLCFCLSDFKLEIFLGHIMKMLLILFLIIICSHVSMSKDPGKFKKKRERRIIFTKFCKGVDGSSISFWCQPLFLYRSFVSGPYSRYDMRAVICPQFQPLLGLLGVCIS